MRVLITGGAGFIGSHIVDACRAAGHEPFVVDNLSSGSKDNLPADVRLFEVDICDQPRLFQVFKEVRPEVVCHQAAQMSVSRSVREPAFDAQVNILGLIQVFDEAVRVGCRRIVFASSGGVLYGDVTEPADENTPSAPISPYGISKWAGEQYLRFYVREHGVTGVAMRYANVYGPRQNPHGEAGVVAIFCKKMLAGEAATINGDGKYDRDYVFGPDVAAANVKAFTAEIPGGFMAFNIGTGIKTDVNQLEDLVRREVQLVSRKTVPPPHHGPARAGDLRSSVVDAGRAAKVLGWQPSATLAEGIRRTVAWFASAGG
jgi:UDP-glucose 4-epimerase